MLDTQPITDDYSMTFSICRAKLFGKDGQRYILFVRGLRPKYWIVYRDIAFGYFFLILSWGLTVAAPYWGMPGLLAAIVGAISIGYWIAYLQLFLHEAAHYNLAPTKVVSDRVCDLVVSWMIGTTVAAYRPIHFQHHRDLGTTKDTEFTYFFPLNLVFLLKAVLGIRAIEIALSRVAVSKAQKQSTDRRLDKGALVSMAMGVTVYGVVIAVSLFVGWWWAALGSALGVGMAFPFFGALRQLLEHRHEGASSKIDYAKQDQGAFTRMFSDDLFSATFGGAGFNRHLLHHWEPQVSYTNLPELDAFLEGTEMKRIMDRRRTTYLATFRRLLSQP